MWKRILSEEQCVNIRKIRASSKWLRKPNAPRVSPRLVLGRSGCLCIIWCDPRPWRHHGSVTQPTHHDLFGSSPLLTPPHTHTYPLFLSRARSGIPAKLQGSREGYPLWEYKEAQLFSVINHTASRTEKMPMASLRTEVGPGLAPPSFRKQKQCKDPRVSGLTFTATHWGRGLRGSFEELQEQPVCKPSFLTPSSKSLLWGLATTVFSHTRVLCSCPPARAISHSGMGGGMGNRNEMHSALFANYFQPCGESYF